MKFSKTLLAAGVALAAMVSPAMAQEEAPSFSLSANVGVFSDYVFRGISQTQEDPAVQGGLDASYGIFYAGAWASNVDFGYPGVNLEYDIYAGIKPEVGPLTLDIGVIYYGYDSQEFDEPYTEFKLGASHSYENGAGVGVALFYSPEFFGNTGTATYYEVNGSYPLGKVGPFAVGLGGAVGYQEVERAVDYTSWRLGLTGVTDAGIEIGLNYHGADEDFGPIGDDRVVIHLKYSFGIIG